MILTVRGIFENGRITFVDDVPYADARHVLVTFLESRDDTVLVPRKQCEALLRAATGADNKIVVLSKTAENQGHAGLGAWKKQRS